MLDEDKEARASALIERESENGKVIKNDKK
jgi:hypothetical protein